MAVEEMQLGFQDIKNDPGRPRSHTDAVKTLPPEREDPTYLSSAVTLLATAGSGAFKAGCGVVNTGIDAAKNIKWESIASNIEYTRDLTLSALPNEAIQTFPKIVRTPFSLSGTFKVNVPFEERKALSETLRKKFPESVCVVVERASWSTLPLINKNRFVVPGKMTIAEFTYTIRSKFDKLDSHQGIYLILGGVHVSVRNVTLNEIYSTECDDDGIIYFKYSEENIFG